MDRRQGPVRHPLRGPLHRHLIIAVPHEIPDSPHGEFESECPGYCGAQDTFNVGTMKGVGRIYQQTFIDTYAKVAFAKLYDRKTPITAADLLNDRVVPSTTRMRSRCSGC
jgi:transglutaminase-like putative cysteine protease